MSSVGGGTEVPSALTSTSTLRQQLEHERRLRQQAESRCKELKVENEKCTIRVHELQRNFEGVQSQLRKMAPSQNRVGQLSSERTSLDETCSRYEFQLKTGEEERERLAKELALAKAAAISASQTSSDTAGENRLRNRVDELQKENAELQDAMRTKQEKYDKTLSEITGEIVSSLTKHEAVSKECRELQARCDELHGQCDKQRLEIVALERKNQTFLKLLSRIKSKQATLTESVGEDSHYGVGAGSGGGAGGSDHDLARNGSVLGKGSSLVNLELEVLTRHMGHLPVRSASLRSAVHPLRRAGLRRSVSGNVSKQPDYGDNDDDGVNEDLSSSDYNISRSNDSRSMHSLLSSATDLRGMGHFRHRLLHSSQSKPAESAIHEQSSGESRPPSLPDLSMAPGYNPNRVGKTPDSHLPPLSGLGSRASALSITSLTKLEGQLSRCTNRSIDSVTVEHLQRMKRDGTLAAHIKTHSNGDHGLPAAPSPTNRGSLIESDSSEEEEDHINFVEMWKKRSTDPSRSSKLAVRGRPLSQVDAASVSRKAAAEEKSLDPKTSSLPRNVSLSTALLGDLGGSSTSVLSVGSNKKGLAADAHSQGDASPSNKPPEIAASARALLLDSLVTERVEHSETSPPLSPGRIPSLAEAKDYLRCLRRRNVNNEKPLRGPMTIIQFSEKNYFSRCDTPEEAALNRFDFLDTFQFVDPTDNAHPQLKPPVALPPSPKSPRSVPASPKSPSPKPPSPKAAGSPKPVSKTAKPVLEKRASSVKARPNTPTSTARSATLGSVSRSSAAASVDKKQSSLISRRSSSGGSVGSSSPSPQGARPKTPTRTPSPQVAKRPALAATVNPATRTKSSNPVTLSKTPPPTKARASKTTSSPLRTSSSSAAAASTATKSSASPTATKSNVSPTATKSSSSGGRRLGALLGHHSSSSSKSSSSSSAGHDGNGKSSSSGKVKK